MRVCGCVGVWVCGRLVYRDSRVSTFTAPADGIPLCMQPEADSEIEILKKGARKDALTLYCISQERHVPPLQQQGPQPARIQMWLNMKLIFLIRLLILVNMG